MRSWLASWRKQTRGSTSFNPSFILQMAVQMRCFTSCRKSTRWRWTRSSGFHLGYVQDLISTYPKLTRTVTGHSLTGSNQIAKPAQYRAGKTCFIHPTVTDTPTCHRATPGTCPARRSYQAILWLTSRHAFGCRELEGLWDSRARL